MAWRDQMQGASWKGAPFPVTSHSKKGGMQGAHHQYPMRDQGYVEHFSLKDDELTLTAKFVGPNYREGRDTLEAALKSPGAGELVHPWIGRFQASVNPSQDYTLTESVEKGGMAIFTMHFIKSGKVAAPNVKKDTGLSFNTDVSNAKDSAVSWFDENVTLKGVPGFVVEGMAGDLSVLNDQISGLSIIEGISFEKLIPVALDIIKNKGDLAAQIKSGLDLVGGQQALMKVMNTLPAQVQSGFAAIPNVVGEFATPSRITQLINQTELGRFVSVNSALNLAKAVGTADFDNYSDAMAGLQSATDALDTVTNSVADAGDDRTWQFLETARSSLINHVKSSSGDLARIVNLVEPITKPALLQAYNLYGDLTRVDEITKRNKVSNPNKMPGGKQLEVLSV